jgi:single-stranded DNA-binding protein
MQFINKIEIQGITGAVKVSSVGDTRVARFSVCTETTYNGAGGIVVDCTWFNVTCFQSDKITCLDQLGKGKIVRVLGRVRVQRYTDENGTERSCWEVLAHKLEIMEE